MSLVGWLVGGSECAMLPTVQPHDHYELAQIGRRISPLCTIKNLLILYPSLSIAAKGREIEYVLISFLHTPSLLPASEYWKVEALVLTTTAVARINILPVELEKG